MRTEQKLGYTRKQMAHTTGLLLAGTLLLALLAGCKVTEGKGKDKDVSIDTPFGGMNVKTDPSAVLGKIGLPAYPGSTPVARPNDSDSADVNFSFGSFKLQVLATALQTPDSEDAVEGFYRKALTQYSDVIACHGQQPVGTPTRTGMGLTCKDGDKTVHADHHSDDSDLELKAGSQSRQHIVALKQKNGGTSIELVSLDLPKGNNE